MSQNDDHVGQEDEDPSRTLDAGKPLYEIGSHIGSYKLLRILGEGGFGIVYLAEQQRPMKRQVALKIIKPGMDSTQVIRRFEAERQALALLDHPNVAHVYDAGTTEAGRPYFAMEYVKGVPITEHCDRQKLTIEERLKLFVKVCEAIQHAHQKGIIHRDIKPSNIQVCIQDEQVVPKVIDFGVAKALSQPLTERTLVTEQGQLIGTPEYISPEQAEMTNQDIDTRSDIYSLGVLLYELLTGTLPFESQTLRKGSLEQMRQIIRETEPRTPSTRVSSLDAETSTKLAKCCQSDAATLRRRLRGDLDWITLKAMEKDRIRRYQTAHALAEDIERHLNNEPVLAGRPGTLYRFQKLVRRNKGVFAAVAVVAAVLVLGVLVSSWQAIRATQAEREQSRLREDAVAAQEKETALRRQVQAEAYASSMNLAQQAWEQNNVGRLRQLLEETATYSGRGFEWYYWQRQTHLESRTLRGHLGPIFSVAFSPDGRRIVTSSRDQTAKVWDAVSGRELLTLEVQRGDSESVAFSPDGQRIVTGNFDQTATVWDVASRTELLTLKEHTSGISSVAFSPDGQRIVTGSYDGKAKVWDVASRRALWTLGYRDYVNSVAFSPDGQRIVAGSEDKTAKILEAASGKVLVTVEGHSLAILSVAFSPDGRQIVTGSKDQTARVWDAASGRELRTLKGHSDWVNSVAFSPDGQRIVTGSKDQTARVWDAASGRELLSLKGHSAGIWSVSFSPDGQRIVTGSYDQTAKIWAQDSDLVSLEGHSAPIRSAAVSPDGRRIVTGGDDETARVWEAVSGKLLRSLEGHAAPIRSVGFSPDGERIVTSSDDQTVRVWEAATGNALPSLEGHAGPVWSAVFSPDGQRIVTGSDDWTINVWEIASRKPVLTLREHSAPIRSVAVSRDGRRIASGSLDKTAKVWDAVSGSRLLTLEGHTGAIWSVAFSPDGQRIVTGSDDRTARVWEAASGKPILTLRGHSATIRSVAFSPDGQRIVTGSSVFSALGRLSSLGGDDLTAKVWEATGGRELLSLKGHSAGIWSVSFSPDGQRIVTGSYDQTAKVWQAASPQQVDAWQQEEKVAKERLEVLRRERDAVVERDRALRAQDPGVLRQWLVLAPIRFTEDRVMALDRAQIAGEGRLRPRAGQRVRVGDRELTWRKVQLDDYLIDFCQLLGEITEFSVAYAVCYVQSEAAHSGLLMKVGSDDEAKVFINGREVYRYAAGRTYLADQDVVQGVELGRTYLADQDVVQGGDLNAGLNVVVFKVVNGLGLWQGSIRFTDAAGQPVKGIRVTLDPEAKDQNTHVQ